MSQHDERYKHWRPVGRLRVSVCESADSKIMGVPLSSLAGDDGLGSDYRSTVHSMEGKH